MIKGFRSKNWTLGLRNVFECNLHQASEGEKARTNALIINHFFYNRSTISLLLTLVKRLSQ